MRNKYAILAIVLALFSINTSYSMRYRQTGLPGGHGRRVGAGSRRDYHARHTSATRHRQSRGTARYTGPQVSRSRSYMQRAKGRVIQPRGRSQGYAATRSRRSRSSARYAGARPAGRQRYASLAHSRSRGYAQQRGRSRSPARYTGARPTRRGHQTYASRSQRGRGLAQTRYQGRQQTARGATRTMAKRTRYAITPRGKAVRTTTQRSIRDPRGARITGARSTTLAAGRRKARLTAKRPTGHTRYAGTPRRGRGRGLAQTPQKGGYKTPAKKTYTTGKRKTQYTTGKRKTQYTTGKRKTQYTTGKRKTRYTTGKRKTQYKVPKQKSHMAIPKKKSIMGMPKKKTPPAFPKGKRVKAPGKGKLGPHKGGFPGRPGLGPKIKKAPGVGASGRKGRKKRIKGSKPGVGVRKTGRKGKKKRIGAPKSKKIKKPGGPKGPKSPGGKKSGKIGKKPGGAKGPGAKQPGGPKGPGGKQPGGPKGPKGPGGQQQPPQGPGGPGGPGVGPSGPGRPGVGPGGRGRGRRRRWRRARRIINNLIDTIAWGTIPWRTAPVIIDDWAPPPPEVIWAERPQVYVRYIERIAEHLKDKMGLAYWEIINDTGDDITIQTQDPNDPGIMIPHDQQGPTRMFHPMNFNFRVITRGIEGAPQTVEPIREFEEVDDHNIKVFIDQGGTIRIERSNKTVE